MFFFACMALGVGALVGVSGFSSNLELTIQKEARNLMAGDLEIHSHQPLSPHSLSVVQSLQTQGIQSTTVQELIAMVSNLSGTETQLVELKAVGAGYPFYGKLITEPPDVLEMLFNANKRASGLARAGAGCGGIGGCPEGTPHGSPHAIVEEALLIRLGLRVGERIRLGQTEFTIAGIIKKEPDRIAGAFSLGPRLMISQEGLAATALIQPGSRVRYRTLLKLPRTLDIESIKLQIRSAIADEKVRVTSYQEAQPRLRRFLKNLTTYLGLVGLTALLVGGIGVANSVQVFLRGKLDTLAILKCLGAGFAAIFCVYLIQTMVLGFLGCLAGVALGLGVQYILPTLLAGFLPAELEWHLSALPVFRGITMGLITTLLFSLWPLLGIRSVPPAHIFRRDVVPEVDEHHAAGRQSSSYSMSSVWIVAAITAGLVFLALWQAGSLNVGGPFIGVLAASLILLRLGAGLVIRLVKAFIHPRPLVWRHGLANLYRPGSQAILAVLSIGVGVTVILAVHLVERSLLLQVGENIPKDAPSFFFIDIQRDQKDGFQSLVSQQGMPTEMTPIVRARLHAVEDKKVADMDLSGRGDAWYFQREYVLTSQKNLPRDNKVKRGQWWDMGSNSGSPQISVEEDAAHHLGVDLGSTLTFDVQGVLVSATATSIREVNWGNLSTNFFVIFSPGVLDAAPTTYIATVRSKPEQDVSLQRRIVSAFPNITAINIRHVLETVRHVLEQIGLVVRFMAAFTIAAGLVVLSGAIATTRHWRTREAVLLKTLGATRSLVARTFAVEYAVLGAIAGLVGTGMASLLAFILLRFVMDVPWQFQPATLLIGIMATLILTMVSGFLTTFRILGQKPLAVLRHE
jgi:putative ABC transport system permease protein